MAKISVLGNGMLYLEEGPIWVSKNELLWLYDRAVALPQGAVIVEIGSFFGRSSLALYTPDKLLICVDTFTGTEGDKSGDVAKTVPDVFDVFRRNVKAAKANLAVICGDSIEVSKCFANDSLDMVWIDGDHFHVYEDLVAWYPKAKGLICGHDYTWKCVQDQVGRFAKENALKIRLLDTELRKYSIWVLENGN